MRASHRNPCGWFSVGQSITHSFLELGLLALIVALTLATGYIHYWVGGMTLMLNAVGYLGLAILGDLRGPSGAQLHLRVRRAS